jgi:flagellar hook assembly protein FlgD
MGPAQFKIYVPKRGRIEIVGFNSNGQRVTTLTEGTFAPGVHPVKWTGTDDEGQNIAAGVYFISLTYIDSMGNRDTLVKKTVYLR